MRHGNHILGAFALASSLVGCGVAAEDTAATAAASDDVTVRADGYFTLTRDTRRCASPACGGYFVDPVNASSARCADGTTAARCYVGAVDLSALPRAGSERSGLASARGEIVIRGRIGVASGNAYGQLVATEAWRSVAGAAPTSSVSRVSTTGTTCTFVPCEALNLLRANGSATALPVVGVDLSRLASLDEATRDEVLGAATRDGGSLVAGPRKTIPGNPSTTLVPYVHATGAFVRMAQPARTGLCGDALRDGFAWATERLLYTSETDAPFTWFTVDGARTVPSDAALLAHLGIAAGTPVAHTTLDAFFTGPLTAGDPGLAEQHRVARFRQLKRALEGNLTGVTVLRVGTVQIRVFIVGVTRCGTVAGLETLAVET